MSVQEYIASLDRRILDLAPVIVDSSIQRDIDTSLGIGFIKGCIRFLDGSVLDFSEQVPV